VRNLNLDHLRALTEVVRQGSFSAAARTLNLTQPAVSLQIRELESRVGVRLIERLGKQAHATIPGRDLIAHAQRIFRECEAVEESMRRFRDGWLGRVHIGTTLTALMYQLPPILRELRSTHPRVDLVVTNMATRLSVERILDNTIDLALVTLPVKSEQLRITPLRPQTLVAIFPTGTKDIPAVVTPEYAAQQSLVLEHDQGAVHGLIMRWLEKQMPLNQAPMHVGITEAAKQAVASGLGMSIVPDISVAAPSSDYVVRPLDPPIPSPLGLIEHRNKPDGPAIEIVRRALLGLRTMSAEAPDGGGSGKQPTVLRPMRAVASG
jgi:DNA-binding transcriptional LysR family regulator